MAYLLRIINLGRWYDEPWIAAGDVKADALLDLRPEDNTLSLWNVEDDERNLDEIIAALAAFRKQLAKFDYALFSQSDLQALGVRLEDEPPGETHDPVVNGYHMNAVQLSISQVVSIAKLIKENRRQRADIDDVTRLIARAIASNRIRLDAIGDDLRRDFEKRRSLLGV